MSAQARSATGAAVSQKGARVLGARRATTVAAACAHEDPASGPGVGAFDDGAVLADVPRAEAWVHATPESKLHSALLNELLHKVLCVRRRHLAGTLPSHRRDHSPGEGAAKRRAGTRDHGSTLNLWPNAREKL